MNCPKCGSHRFILIRKGYRPVLGCLGVLLFNWIGLLLGFLGSDDLDRVCLDCGHREPLTKTGCGTCCLFFVLMIVLLLLMMMATAVL